MILVADVVGYSRLAGADEERRLARLRVLRSDLIDPSIALHHGRIHFERLAITVRQIKAYGLPLRSTKSSDSRAAIFAAKFGEGSVELDALRPNVLRNLVRLAINRTDNSLASYSWTNQHGGRCVGLEHRDKSRVAARRYGRPEPEAARIGEQRVIVRRRRDRLVELNLIDLAQQHAG
jgi:class 3 adenylate cyclase